MQEKLGIASCLALWVNWMHGASHNRACQINFLGRNQQGAGWSVGEQQEHTFAYLAVRVFRTAAPWVEVPCAFASRQWPVFSEEQVGLCAYVLCTSGRLHGHTAMLRLGEGLWALAHCTSFTPLFPLSSCTLACSLRAAS